MESNGGTIAGSVLAIAALIVVFSVQCWAPCSWFGCVALKDVPGRCVEGVRVRP